jgi:3-dehydroquinate dehydratase/shikimate dehydrogenase
MVLASEAGADLVELRIDLFDDSRAISKQVSDSTVRCIVTRRPIWEGGECQMPDNARLESLAEISDEGEPAYVDLEWETFEKIGELDLSAAARVLVDLPDDSRQKLILSAHDFKGRPKRLYGLFAAMNQSKGDVIKIVWTARTIRDNLEAFELLQQRQKPTIALCMGEAGLISRVLAKKFEAFLSFASLGRGAETAPGQVSIHDMKRLFRWDAIGPKTKVYGVVANPVAHSMSPAIHNAAFDETGFDGVYLPLLVNEGYESFKAFMESFVDFPGLDLSGLSVTLPHKENALRYFRERGAEIEPLAETIGAVNTIVIDRADGLRLRGMNTDYAAILDSITEKLGISRQQLADYRVAVIGAGGTGRTAVAALARYGATVVVYNRTRERADSLAAEFNGKTGQVVSAAMEKLCDSCCHIFINTTSVGMHPGVDESPLGDREPQFTADTLVFDTIYNPPKTRLLEQAERAGAKTIGGIEMFIRQAAAQFHAWTGFNPPLQIMRAVVEKRLGAASEERRA